MCGIEGHHLEKILLDTTIGDQEKFKGLEVEPKDMVQDILFKVFKNMHTYNRLYSLSTWVYNIAKNYVVDLYRKNKPRGVSLSIHDMRDEDMVDQREGVVDRVTEKDAAERCRECILSLPARDQRIIF